MGVKAVLSMQKCCPPYFKDPFSFPQISLWQFRLWHIVFLVYPKLFPILCFRDDACPNLAFTAV